VDEQDELVEQRQKEAPRPRILRENAVEQLPGEHRKGSKKSSTAIGRRVDSSGDSGVNAEKAANARTL